nr:Crp/Fnr family transcriptional regulator [Micromonospora sp. DSM 115978]
MTVGDRSDHVVLLVAGSVRITVPGPASTDILIAVRIGGDIVGELAGIEAKPRMATVEAASATVAKEISLREFDAFQLRFPEVMRDLQRALAAKLGFATRRQISGGAYPVAVRLARVLVDLAVAYGEANRETGEVVVDV